MGITEVTITESEVQTLAPAAGFEARNLAVRTAAAPAPGSALIVTLRAGGADTGLSCTIVGAANACSDTARSADIDAATPISLAVSSTGTVAGTSLLIGFEGG